MDAGFALVKASFREIAQTSWRMPSDWRGRGMAEAAGGCEGMDWVLTSEGDSGWVKSTRDFFVTGFDGEIGAAAGRGVEGGESGSDRRRR